MRKKNPDLCERAYCRSPWEWDVRGIKRSRRTWRLRVCTEHAAAYMKRQGSADFGASVTISARSLAAASPPQET